MSLRSGSIMGEREEDSNSEEEKSVLSNLKSIGAPQYSEKDFYNLFKISRKDWLSSIEEGKESKAVDKLFESKKTNGRKVDLEKSWEKIIQKTNLTF